MNRTKEDKRQEFAAFLRARRSEISPSQVGLPAQEESRKVRGLRREEVAHLAGISVDYYARLEQGRLPAPSGGVIDAIADALRLNDDQRDYLRQLGDRAPAPRPRAHRQVVPEPVRAVLSDLATTPAVVLGRFMDVLAWNSMAAELLTDFAKIPEGQRNYLRLAFLDPEMRNRVVDWEQTARECVSYLRMDASRHPSDPRMAAMVTELSDEAPEFRRWWSSYKASSSAWGTKHLRHPMVGELRLTWQILTVAQDRDQFLVVLSPADDESRHRLMTLRGAVLHQSDR
ncbi:helix-turn-helix transcriptional regulator [Streptomyces sp. NPDC059861]|uniref:helix-turn-helix transcriptional regulator n=1 Tax=Streptomyces sp. NPDC059861 TaxID=3346974 RepID=UPI003645FE1D